MSDEQQVNAAASADTLTKSLDKLHEKWKGLPPQMQGQLIECWRHDHRMAERTQRLDQALVLAVALIGWFGLLALAVGLLGSKVFLRDGQAVGPYEALVLGLFVVVAGAPPLIALGYLGRSTDD